MLAACYSPSQHQQPASSQVEAALLRVPEMPRSEPSQKKAKTSKPKAPPRIDIKVSWCKGCGLCVEYCNRGVLEMNGTKPRVVQAERCSRCLQCEAICPDFAIDIDKPQDPEAS